MYSRLRCITTLSLSLTQAARRAVEGAIAQGHMAVEVHTNSRYVIDGTRGGEGRRTGDRTVTLSFSPYRCLTVILFM